MKFSAVILGSIFSWSWLCAESLTQADLEELRARLKAIQEGAIDHQEKRFKGAAEDFRAALQDENAALDLYLKCVELVDYTEQQKKGQDFRDWKRENEARLKNPEFRQALRYQLNWLSLTIRAAARPAEIHKLSPDALDALRAIFANAKNIAGQRELLNRPVLDSVYARAYQIGDLELKNWPTSPLQVSAIFDQIILPPLRQPDSIASLSSAWDSRIQMELAKVAEFSGPKPEASGLQRSEPQSPAEIAFRKEQLPDLLWKKQVDLFQCGDQRAAALRMLTHINDHMTSSQASAWIEQFQQLVSPSARPAQQNGSPE
ncbi:MAG: hypothetical protein ACOVRB_01950 [Akkermansiaceae bacterium]